jgi:hypothetical protein
MKQTLRINFCQLTQMEISLGLLWIKRGQQEGNSNHSQQQELPILLHQNNRSRSISNISISQMKQSPVFLDQHKLHTHWILLISTINAYIRKKKTPHSYTTQTKPHSTSTSITTNPKPRRKTNTLTSYGASHAWAPSPRASRRGTRTASGRAVRRGRSAAPSSGAPIGGTRSQGWPRSRPSTASRRSPWTSKRT